MFLRLPLWAESPKERATILVINSYYSGFYWTDRQVEGILETFEKSDYSPEFIIEYLDVLRGDYPKNDEAFLKYFHGRYPDVTIDVVIVTDNAALEFLVRHHGSFLEGIPIVFSDVNRPDTEKLREFLPMTGVAEENDYQGSFNVALDLQPDAKRVVIFGYSIDLVAGPEVIQESILNADLELPVVLFADLSYEEILAQAEKLNPSDIVFPLCSTTDQHGIQYSFDRVAQGISSHSPAPTYSFRKSNEKGIALGGFVYGPKDQGEEAAGLAIRVLQGESANDISVISGAPMTYEFDYTLMKRWGIEESDLPEGSVIHFRPESFYRDHKGIIWGTAVLVVILLWIIAALSRAVHRQQVAEASLAAHKDRLEEIVEDRTQTLTTGPKQSRGIRKNGCSWWTCFRHCPRNQHTSRSFSHCRYVCR